MDDYGRRIVLDLGFKATVDSLDQAMRAEGLRALARIDVRDHFGRELGHDFRHYVLIEAWSPDLALDALRGDLGAGTSLFTSFALYELADGETAVVVQRPLASVTDDSGWRRDAPALAAIADRESGRIARVLDRVQRASLRHGSAVSAA